MLAPPDGGRASCYLLKREGAWTNQASTLDQLRLMAPIDLSLAWRPMFAAGPLKPMSAAVMRRILAFKVQAPGEQVTGPAHARQARSDRPRRNADSFSGPRARRPDYTSHTVRGSRQFHSYVSRRLIKTSGEPGVDGLRLPARKIEMATVEAVSRYVTKKLQQLAA